MNAGSAAVLALVLALSALAIWRAWTKGAPCACGGCQKPCGDCGRCGGQAARAGDNSCQLDAFGNANNADTKFDPPHKIRKNEQ